MDVMILSAISLSSLKASLSSSNRSKMPQLPPRLMLLSSSLVISKYLKFVFTRYDQLSCTILKKRWQRSTIWISSRRYGGTAMPIMLLSVWANGFVFCSMVRPLVI